MRRSATSSAVMMASALDQDAVEERRQFFSGSQGQHVGDVLIGADDNNSPVAADFSFLEDVVQLIGGVDLLPVGEVEHPGAGEKCLGHASQVDLVEPLLKDDLDVEEGVDVEG